MRYRQVYGFRLGTIGMNQVGDVRQSNSQVGKNPPLRRVTYPNLWEGVSLAYEADHGGIFRSTYTLAAGADPNLIRLRYNAPAALEPDGSLRVEMAPGWMTESAPVAWQEKGDLRMPVRVAFRIVSDGVVGFSLGRHDRELPVIIDPTLTWNTFLGSLPADYGESIAVDGSGNIYGRDSDLSRIETQLRAVNPDGTVDTLLYGAMRGGFYVPLRPMPDSLQDSGSDFRRGTDFHIGYLLE